MSSFNPESPKKRKNEGNQALKAPISDPSRSKSRVEEATRDPALKLSVRQEGLRFENEEEINYLKSWDLDSVYGPCVGITRLQRWNRAVANRLEPPARVKELLDGSDHPSIQMPLWTGVL